MSSINHIIESILRGIATNSEKKIIIREDRIIDKILEDKVFKRSQWKKYFNQILLLTLGTLLFIYALLSMISFFLFDVILFEPKVYTTSKGATIITQPCDIEQAFFIHNSASVWTDSGIDIAEGDKIEITYAGSFYSSLRNQAEASLKNVPLKYPWFSFQRTNKASPTTTIECCMYDSIEDNAAIGDFLCRIEPHQLESNYIYQINHNRKKFKAEHDGTLQVSVNDIYISDTRILKKILAAPDTVFDRNQKEELIKRLDFDNQHIKHKDLLLQQCTNLDSQYIDTLLINGADWHAQNIWYDDNSGELFVNVRIVRNHLHYSNPINKLFARLYRTIDFLWNKNKLIIFGSLILLILLYIQLILFFPFWTSFYYHITRLLSKHISLLKL